jgi:hypothetical protein
MSVMTALKVRSLSLADIAGGFDVIALAQQGQLIERAQVRLIVDDKNAGVLGSSHQWQSVRTKGRLR